MMLDSRHGPFSLALAARGARYPRPTRGLRESSSQPSVPPSSGVTALRSRWRPQRESGLRTPSGNCRGVIPSLSQGWAFLHWGREVSGLRKGKGSSSYVGGADIAGVWGKNKEACYLNFHLFLEKNKILH